MDKPILVLNAGSSSLKFSIFDALAGVEVSLRLHGQVEEIDARPRLEVFDSQGKAIANRSARARGHEGAIAEILQWFADHVGQAAAFGAVGHRIVHGGEKFTRPVVIDDRVLEELEALVLLAPLHQPHNIAAVRAMEGAAAIPQVACFDTSFHADQPELARIFALPKDMTARGIRRYGFHGLSYEYIVSVLPRFLADRADGKIVVAHLGNGASLCAIEKGRSIATTMGLTALDGLPMGTRSGALDPGVLLYLLQHEGMDPRILEKLLYERSGLLGMSGISADVRELLASKDASAKTAIDFFVYRICRELGSLAAALGGLDALVFTAGIGEHAAAIRERVCRQSRWLGIELDEAANAANGRRVSATGSPVSAWVIPTDENLVIARHTRSLIEAAARA